MCEICKHLKTSETLRLHTKDKTLINTIKHENLKESDLSI